MTTDAALGLRETEPPETFAVTLPAGIAEQVRELAEVHVGGDPCRMIARMVVRMLDPIMAARMEELK